MRMNDRGSFHVHESWYNVNIYTVCQIIGLAAAGSVEPVPMSMPQYGIGVFLKVKAHKE